jgi:L-ascorbate metabolism protein UlaG (beta-lactamase superfamily)
MMPEEVMQAASDLQTKVLMPVHWGKFTLALHSWNEPVIRLTQQIRDSSVKITTPLIGDVVTLDQPLPDSVWWEF